VEGERVRVRHLDDVRFVLFASMFLAGLSSRALSQDGITPTPTGPKFPRLANIYLHGAVNAADVPALARWDLLVLDSVWTDEQLAWIRTLNPDIKIFFYTCPYCIAVPVAPGDAWRRVNYDYAESNDLWWRNADRSIASDWPNVQMANMTDWCPRGPQGNWRSFLAWRIRWLMATRPSLDGVFFDNFWNARSWQQGNIVRLDSDCNPTHNPAGCDGVMDSPALLDSLWNQACRGLASEVRAHFDLLDPQRPPQRPLAILANGASDYFPWLNGTMYEHFPSGHANVDPWNPHGYNWNHEMLDYPDGYLAAPFRPEPYNAQILNAEWRQVDATGNPIRDAEFERHKRFTFGSALLGDGFYSLDAGTNHGALWWEPEYDNGGLAAGYLGRAKGPMVRVARPNGPELVQNGSFGIFSSPWRAQPTRSDGTLELDFLTPRTTPAAAKLEIRSTEPGGSLKLYQEVPVLGGFGYTLRFWARSDSPRTLLVHLYSEDCVENRCLGDRTFLLSTNWKLFEVSFVSLGNTRAGLNFLLQEPGTVWLDDVSLQLGDTSVYRRDFENGIVLVNYTNHEQTVELGGTFYRMFRAGMTDLDGAAVRRERVPPSDARILLRDPVSTDVTAPPAAANALQQNRPNPFNPTTRIQFTLARDEDVHLQILDLAGRKIRTVLLEPRTAGLHEVEWDGTDTFGRRVASGVYLYRITTPSLTETRKLTLVQ
jgi:hypothetical protein